MALDPKDQTLMRDAFYDALTNWSKKSGGSLGGSGGSGAAPLTQTTNGTTLFGKAVTEAGNAAKQAGSVITGLASGALDLGVRMAKGGLTVTDATKIMGGALKDAGFAGSTLSASLGKTVDKFGDLINYVEEGLDTFRDLSKTGVTFNNSVVDMQAAAAGSRLTLREFGNLIKENNGNFLALGGSAGKGAKEFARLSKSFFDSGFGDKLTQLGYTSEDLNNLMAIQMSNMTARELKAKGGDTAQFQATVKLAEEMDAMAKLTGKSRKEQEAAMKAAQADGQRLNAIQELKNKGVAGAQDAFNAVTTNTVGQFQTLIQDMVTAGRPLTKEMGSYYGLLSEETKKQIQLAREAVQGGDVKSAEEAAKRAMALEAKETVTNSARIRIGTQGNAIQKKAIEDQGRLGNLILEKEKELKEKGLTGNSVDILEAARKQLADEIAAEQKGRSGETASIIEAQNRIKDMGSAIQESIIVPLKDTANKVALNDFHKNLAAMNQTMAKGGSATSEQGFAGDVSAFVKPVMDGILAGVVRMFSETGPDQKFSSDEAKATNQAQASALQKAIEGTNRKEFAVSERNEIYALAKSLKSVDGEAVSKQLEKIAKDQGKSSADVLKEAINKPGGIGNLSKQIGEDSAAKKQLIQAAETVKKEQSNKDLTNTSQSKGRDTSGTARESAISGAGEILSKLGTLTTKSIDLFRVEGGVNINGKGIGGEGFAEGGVAKGPDSGYFALLHGEETIIPNKDIDTVIKGAISKLPIPDDQMSMSENTDRAYKAMQSMNPARMFSELRAATSGSGKGGGVNLNEIAKNISTTISRSVTGGDSTTGKMVQSEDSKNAESEMKRLRDQFNEDWSKRKEVLIQGMAVEDRKFSKVQAAMKADEDAMKIKEDFEKKKADLQKKIDDGFKWEIDTTKAAEEEKKKVLTSSSDEIAAAMEKMLTAGQAVSEKAAKTVVSGMSFDSVFNPVRTSAQSMMEKFGKENEQKKAEEAKAAADKSTAKPENAEKKTDSKLMPTTAAGKGSATLDDVVSSLDRLNMHMGQLLSQHEDIGKKQLRASKANSVQP